MIFFNSLYSEWLKLRKSAASWLCLAGGFFIPLIYLSGFLKRHSSINGYPTVKNAWYMLSEQVWQSMAYFLLPIGIILVVSLITQIEYKNNTWKLVNTTPQPLTTVFFAKLGAILLLTLQFFIFFNIGILLAGLLPSLFFDGKLPDAAFPFYHFWHFNGQMFVSVLPLIALQYLLSLHFKNFIIPLGIGMLALIGTLIAQSWKYIFISPYIYPIWAYSNKAHAFQHFDKNMVEWIFFLSLIAIGYAYYLLKKEKG